MSVIDSVPFSHLKNAEHVAFLNNVCVAITKVTPEAIGLASELFKKFTDVVAVEQDIVNHSTGSVYTPEMQALDDERDRLFRLIRLKLQAVLLASSTSEVAQYATTIEQYILKKYGLEVAAAAYQEETSLIRGFILDLRNYFSEEAFVSFGIANELTELEAANDGFIDQYNERVTEKSVSETNFGRKTRAEAESVYKHVSLHVEYKAITDTTEVGTACESLIAVFNELIKDVHHRLNTRLGRVPNSDDQPVLN